MEGERSEILASLARAYAAVGNDTAARAAFARALADAGLSVEDSRSPGPEFTNKLGVRQNIPAPARVGLAEIQAMAGDIPSALKTVRSIDDQNDRGRALVRVVSARATAGDVAGALQVGLAESKTPRGATFGPAGAGAGRRCSLVAQMAHPPR